MFEDILSIIWLKFWIILMREFVFNVIKILLLLQIIFIIFDKNFENIKFETYKLKILYIFFFLKL